MDSHKPKSSESGIPKLFESGKPADKWHGHRFCGAGTHSSAATEITRSSSFTLAHVMTTEKDFAVRLPTAPSTVVTAPSTAPAPTYAVVGDVVEVCVDLGSERSAYVWYGATLTAPSGSYEEVAPGRCRLYRYVSGSMWNRYT